MKEFSSVTRPHPSAPYQGVRGYLNSTGSLKKELPRKNSRNERVNQVLGDLIEAARGERLECAVPLIESIMTVMESDVPGIPPGAMTVKGWLGLLNRWERQVEEANRRQLFYAKMFIKEMVEGVSSREPAIGGLLDELLELMDRQLAVENA